MEITSKWIDKFQFKVDNGRNQTVILDVPPNYGGDNTGPTGLELAIMGLASCLGTTYKMIADKMHIEIIGLEVKAIVNKDERDMVTDINLNVKIESNDEPEKLQKVLEMAEQNCPVDNIFHQTKIPMETKLEIVN
ncbi:MAG TPA: OsmC family protein [candidate division Zixibacteria bacterium]|nr:OsmC family protein [candidate division Zixibacteria bacterium]